MKFTIKTNISEQLASAIANRTERATRVVAEQARQDTRQYVPMRGNAGGLDARTRVEGNTIIYPGPYARFLYYGKVMVDPETGSPWAKPGATKVVTDRNLVFTHDYHSDAQAHWFEVSKAQNMDKWLRVAQKAVENKE